VLVKRKIPSSLQPYYKHTSIPFYLNTADGVTLLHCSEYTAYQWKFWEPRYMELQTKAWIRY